MLGKTANHVGKNLVGFKILFEVVGKILIKPVGAAQIQFKCNDEFIVRINGFGAWVHIANDGVNSWDFNKI